MTQIDNPSAILEEIRAIRQDLDFIKDHMVDKDSVLTEDDFEALQNYRVEKSENSLVSEEELHKELGL